MIFPNTSFFHMIVTDWTGPLIKMVLFSKNRDKQKFLGKNRAESLKKIVLKTTFLGIMLLRTRYKYAYLTIKTIVKVTHFTQFLKNTLE